MNKSIPQPVVPVEAPLEMKELATVLVKHYGIHSGKYNLFLEFNVGIGTVGPSPELATPGAMIGISKIGLTETLEDGPTSVDASVVNPKANTHAVKKLAAKKSTAKK